MVWQHFSFSILLIYIICSVVFTQVLLLKTYEELRKFGSLGPIRL